MTDANSTRSVLVVDDDCDLRELVADLLEGAGRRVFTASDGSDALRKLDQDGIPRPCIVLLDWFMAPMGGRGFLDALAERSDSADVKVIVLSASSGTVALRPEAGVLDVLPKPFGIDELMAALRRHD